MGNKDSAVLRDEEFATIANATGMTVDDVEKHYMDFLQANGSDGQISKKEFEETVKVRASLSLQIDSSLRPILILWLRWF